MTPQRDNMKAGLFVLVGFLMFLFVVYTLFDFERLFEQNKEKYQENHLNTLQLFEFQIQILLLKQWLNYHLLSNLNHHILE